MSPGGRRILAALLVSAVGAGCASRTQVERVQRDQREVRALIADQNVAIEGLRRRLEILKQDAGDQARARGGATSTQAMQRLNELDARITALEQHRAIAPAGSEVAPTDEVARPGQAMPTPPPARPQSPLEVAIAKEEAALQGQRVEPDYSASLDLVRQGQCAQAAPRLREYIRRNPKGDLADNAQYWIGACYYSQREYNQAIKELSDVMLRYSKGDKAPAALLMLADAFNDSGDQIDARLVLKKLISEHPRSPEAERAKQKLQALGE